MSNVDINIKFIQGAAEASVSKLKNEVDALDKGVKNLNINLKSTSSFFKNFAANVAASAVNQLVSSFKSLVSGGIEATRQMESINARLVTLTGSAGAANKLLGDLAEFASSTPFELAGIADASATLLAFQFRTEEVLPLLGEIGDVAAASGNDINDLAVIFGQVAAAGKLTGERFIQLAERGVNLGPALAKTMGVAVSEIEKLRTEGKITFDIFQQAFKTLNDEGGLAFQGMIRQSKTLDGVLNSLGDNISIASALVGQSLLPSFKAIAITVTQLVDGFISFINQGNNLSGLNQVVISFADGVAKAVGFVVQFGQVLNVVLSTLSTTLSGIFTGAINIVYGLVEAVGRAVTALASFAGIKLPGLEKFNEEARLMRETFNEDFVNRLDQTGQSINALGGNLDQTSATVASFSSNLKKNFEEISAEAARNANAIDDANQKIIDSEINKTNKLTEEERRKMLEKAKLADEQRQAEIDLFNADQERIALQDGIITEQEKQTLAILNDANQRYREDQILAEQQGLLDAQQFATLKTKIETDRLKRQNDITKADAEMRKKENQRLLSDTANMFGGLAALAQTGGAKLFKVTQALQLAQAITAGIVAVQQAASAAPFPANIPGVIAETARAAASVIQIKQNTPKFEQGGIVPGSSFSGDNVVARVNSGEMILNRSQQARLYDMANGGAQRETVIHTSVVLDGEVVAKAVSRQVANGLQLGSVI